MARRSVHSLRALKDRGERFAMITCYDYPSARLIDQVGIPGVLVGDSLGTVVLGYDSTVPVTMDEIIHHTKPVVRGTERAFVVADMPFGSYQANEDEAMRNAVRLLQEGGATAVKLEGGVRVAGIVERLVASGIPVMGHLGLTPQSVRQLGGHKIQGKTDSAAARMLDDARALERAGAFAVVLECIPAPLGVEISRELRIPHRRHRRGRRLRRRDPGLARRAGPVRGLPAQARQSLRQARPARSATAWRTTCTPSSAASSPVPATPSTPSPTWRRCSLPSLRSSAKSWAQRALSHPVERLESIAAARRWRRAQTGSVGFVATMAPCTTALGVAAPFPRRNRPLVGLDLPQSVAVRP